MKTVSVLAKLLVVVLLAGFVVYRVKLSPVEVAGWRVQSGPIVAEVLGTGTVTARQKTNVGSKIQGRLVSLAVDQNDRVTTGQELARLDDAELREQVAIAGANLDVARSTLERVGAENSRAAAVLAMARVEHGRVSTLEQGKMVSSSDADKSRESLQIAEAETRRAAAAVAEARNQVAAAEKTLHYHEARLADTVITSPFAGLIVRRDKDVGDMAIPGAGIFHVVSTDEIWVSAWIDESARSRVRAGQNARIVFRSDPQTSHAGAVVRVSREVDRETREFLADVRVDSLPEEWAVGQRAEVFVQVARKDRAIHIPSALVRWRDGKPGVFVDEQGAARWRTIKPGLVGRQDTEVEQGLVEGETVVTAAEKDAQKLQPGRRIRVK